MTSLPTLVSCILLAAAPPEPTAPPNVMARASVKLLNEVAGRPVERYQPVEDEILGTMYNGHSITRGLLRVELTPDPTQAVIDLVVQGTIHACSTGWRSRYLAYIDTCIPFETRKRITIDGRQILLHPATACATTHSNILGISDLCGNTSGLRIGIARCVAEESKPQVEAINSFRTQCRLSEQLDKDSYESPAKAARALESALTAVRQAGLAPQPPRWSTTRDYLEVKVAVPVTETVEPPPEAPSDADLVLGIHPSVLNQQAEILFGGKAYGILDLGGVLKRYLTPILREGELDPQTAKIEQLRKTYRDLGLQPVNVVFAKRRPVVFAVTEDGFSVTLRGIRERDDESSTPADVKVSYRAEKTDESFVAVRQGLVEITGGDFIYRTRLLAAFSVFFPERLTLAPVSIPVTTQGKTVRLVSSEFVLRDGWLMLAWVLKNGATK